MENNNYVKQNQNIFGEDDDEIILNPLSNINQFEVINNNNNINTNNFPNQNSLNNQNLKNNMSANSTLNTNAALDESSQNINNNFSFFSFNQNQHREQKKELTQKSIEILSDFISKEKEIIDNNSINFINSNLRTTKIKDLKNNFEKLEKSLNFYFKKPFMRKNYKKQNLFEKLNDNFNFNFNFDEDEQKEEEKKMKISEDFDFDFDIKIGKSKKINKNKIDIDDINEI